MGHRCYSREGELKPDASIKEMREYGYLPTVTTIDSMLANPFLELWKRRGAVDAALDLTDEEKEGDRKEVIDRVLDIPRQISIDAADRGTEIHRGAEDILEGRIWNQADPQLQAVNEWVQAHITKVHYVERCLKNVKPGLGYAGTCDLKADHDEYGTCLIDWKSQNCKTGKNNKPRFNFYEIWPVQLAAYREVEGRELPVVSVIIDKNSKAIKAKRWADEAVDRAFEAFKSLHHLWCWKNNYFPCGTADVLPSEIY